MGVKPGDFKFAFGRVGKQPLDPGRTRLMVADRHTGRIEHHPFAALPDLLAGVEVWANDSLGKHPYFQQQAFYSCKSGSYLPPTAGIPITPAMAKRLNLHLLTLHTYCPSKQEDPWSCYTAARTGREWYAIPRAPSNPVAAVGTTVVKALETWARSGELEGWSDLFVAPPFDFKVVGKFLTNFHWPGEPLLALTCAFGGADVIREAHEVAVREGYLFSDYGDRLLVI